MNIIDKIINTTRSVLPDQSMKYSLHEPTLTGNELKYVSDCVSSGWVSSIGSYVDRFEEDLAKFTGAKHAIAVMNGTAALHMCCVVADIQHDDEVLVPTLTFVATVNAIHYCHAIPHFIDTDCLSFNISTVKLEAYLDDIAILKDKSCYNRITGRRIKALCITHVLGHPANLDALIEICQRYSLILIEDAAEALGSRYKDQYVGSDAVLAALSFNGNKIVTTGGGGAILTNDESLASQLKHLTTTARVKHQWNYFHDQLGYNYRMPNINAALGCAQLEKINQYLSSKRQLAHRYIDAFSNFPAAFIFEEEKDNDSNYWLNALVLDEESAHQRDTILNKLHSNNIYSRPLWELMHRLPNNVDCPRMNLSNAESFWRRVILLPSSPGIVNA